jgi:hypothetical protein
MINFGIIDEKIEIKIVLSKIYLAVIIDYIKINYLVNIYLPYKKFFYIIIIVIMCKKCESKKYESGYSRNKLYNQKPVFNVVKNPNYSVEFNNSNYYNSALQVNNDEKLTNLYNILMN